MVFAISDGPHVGSPPPGFEKSHPSMYITQKFIILSLKCIFWPPSSKILFKLTHEIKTKSLLDHYCIPFAQQKQKPWDNPLYNSQNRITKEPLDKVRLRSLDSVRWWHVIISMGPVLLDIGLKPSPFRQTNKTIHKFK